jgi:hypothetical protein
MSSASKDNDDLKILQQEAAELEESRKRNGYVGKGDAEHPVRGVPAGGAGQAEGAAQDTDKPEDGVDDPAFQDITSQLETFIKEIEETAMEQPTLALLTTFALGIIVGHLFARK